MVNARGRHVITGNSRDIDPTHPECYNATANSRLSLSIFQSLVNNKAFRRVKAAHVDGTTSAMEFLWYCFVLIDTVKANDQNTRLLIFLVYERS